MNNEEDDFSVRSMEELISTFSSKNQILTILKRTEEIRFSMAVGGKGSDILMLFVI